MSGEGVTAHDFAVQNMFPDHHGVDTGWFVKCQECKAS